MPMDVHGAHGLFADFNITFYITHAYAFLCTSPKANPGIPAHPVTLSVGGINIP